MTPFLEKRSFPAGTYLGGMQGCPPLSNQEFFRALHHLKGRYKWRDRALLTLGCRTGLRVSELLSLRIGQVASGAVILPRVYLERSGTKGKQQGASIVLHPQAAAALEKWLRHRGPVTPRDWLFPSQRCPGFPMRRHAAWLLLHKAFLAAGVTGMAGSHCMRKTFSHKVYRALKGDLFRLSKAMRHSSPLTTLRYLSFRQQEIDSAILRA
jgi:integrase